MLINRLFSIILFSIVFPFSVAFSAPPDKGVGLHLGKINDFRSAMPFADIFMYSRPWITQQKGVKEWNTKEKLSLDRNGWIRSFQPGQRALTLMLWKMRKHQPTGVFELTYDGKGRISFKKNVRIVKKSDGKMTLDVREGIGVLLTIHDTDPNDPIRNIKIWMPGTPENGDENRVFNPKYMSLVKDFKVFRFMDWLRANKDRKISWEDRTKPDSSTQATNKGVALEHIISFSNRMKAAPWLNIHHRASDEYVRKFAQFVRKNLDPNLKIYIEYSNEVWNGIFPQSKYAKRKAKGSGLNGSDEFYFRRSIEIFKIFEDVFGGGERLVRVIASQFWNLNRTKILLGFKGPRDQFDALAIAPYIGNKIKYNRKKGVPDKNILLDQLEEILDPYQKQLRAIVALARSEGLPVIAYEGGQHLTGGTNKKPMCVGANRDDRIGDIYDRYLDIWGQETDYNLFVHLTAVLKMGRTGCYGLMEYMDQDPDTAPKFQAMKRYIVKTRAIK